MENRKRVLTLAVAGSYDEHILRNTAERIRDELTGLSGVSLTEIGAAKPLEISIEIPSDTLRAYGITPQDVANRIRSSAIELPAGSIKTEGGEVLVRTSERREYGVEYTDIPIIARPDGSIVRLGDIAEINDGFADIDLETKVDGMPSVTINVYRVGEESPLSVSATVRDYLVEFVPELPEGMHVQILRDDSIVYRDRIDLLLRNAFLGLALVLLMLGLFLEPRLAFWVTLGIPISIIGSFLFLSSTNASINMISLFAFIVTLGIIVDDAIVVGENIYEKREQGMPALKAAIEGAREIAGPVTFAVLTNIVAFMPMLFVPGASARLFMQIPAVAISVFAISLIESIFILPAHLSHAPRRTLFWRIISMPSEFFGGKLQWFIDRVYAPTVAYATREHYLTLACGMAMLILCIGFISGGRIPFTFLPNIDADFISVSARLPVGVSVDRTKAAQDQILEALDKTIEQSGGTETIKNVQAVIGGQLLEMGPIVRPTNEGTNLLAVRVELSEEGNRTISAQEFGKRWRLNTGVIPGIESIRFKSEFGRPAGSAIDAQLSHRDSEILDAASLAVAESLQGFVGVINIDSGVSRGKPQLNYELTPEARSLGLTAAELARQTRSYLFGSEALRQQRGRNELKVMVRLPEEERRTLHTLENLLLPHSLGNRNSPLRSRRRDRRPRVHIDQASK